MLKSKVSWYERRQDNFCGLNLTRSFVLCVNPFDEIESFFAWRKGFFTMFGNFSAQTLKLCGIWLQIKFVHFL